ncbi:MAG: GAF domain-containing protein [Myxococcaceae bacterium]|nr:GAF domain-containing protein [Myxococcaceae bacterium]
MTAAFGHGEDLWRPLSAVGLQLASERTVDALLERTGERLGALGYRFMTFRLRGEETFVRSIWPPPKTSVGQALLRPLKMSAGPLALVREVLQSGRSRFVADARAAMAPLAGQLAGGLTEAEVARQVEAVNLSCLVLVPLRVQGEPWGIAVFGHNALRPEDEPPFASLGAQLEAHLDIAETLARLERKDRELEAVRAIGATSDVLESTTTLMSLVAKATASDTAALHEYDPVAGELVMRGDPFGASGPLVDHFRRVKIGSPQELLTAARGQSVANLENGAEQVKALGFEEVATINLVLEGRPRGLLTLARRAVRPYTLDELNTAELLGTQITQRLERARLQAETTRRLRQLSLLYELTATGAVAGEVDSALHRLLGQMLDAFPADIAVIHFTEGHEFRLAGYRIRDEADLDQGPPTPAVMPLDENSVIGLAARGRRAISLPRSEFPPFTAEAAKRLGMEHMLAAPLLAQGKVVGTLAVVRCTPKPFTHEELRLAESCSAHIAVILEHVRLFEALRLSYRQLEQAQAEVVKHERLAALGELAAVMAHEVRNPLGVIFNALTALRRGPGGSDLRMLLDIVGEEADRLNRIVGDLLDFARPYEAVRKAVPLEQVVASAIDAATQLLPGVPVKVVTELPQALPPFFVDQHLLRQALINLVMNAVQAMPRGGQVTVRVVREPRGTEEWACIEVRDQGVGISPAAAGRIFEPFFTTKATGTGLGLAVVKRIVDAHHGDISVRAAPGGGSIFTILLPGGEKAPRRKEREP